MAASPTEWFENARRYVGEVQSEYRKVTWPSQKEYVGGTVGVVVVVVIVTVVLGTVDFTLNQLLRVVVP